MEHASRQFQPDKITAYFRLEWVNLLLITLSGLLYNLGLLAGPWFEGKLAQCLGDEAVFPEIYSPYRWTAGFFCIEIY